MNAREWDAGRIVREAASLSERIALAARGAHADDCAASAQTDARLRHWLDRSAQGDPDKFERRLGWQGLNPQTARALLQMPEASFSGPEPEWAATVRELVGYLEGIPVLRDPAPEFHPPVPFSDALVPLVEFGMLRLRRLAPELPLSAGIRESVCANLFRLLSVVCALTLGEEFERFRRARGSQPGAGPGSTELYDAFTGGIGLARWRELFTVYPVLARLVATRIQYWTDDTAEFLTRLQQDIPGIEQRFFGGQPLPPARHIRGSLSDPHNFGRAVRIVTFEDGRRIVYKPRSLAIDEAWMNLTAWLAERDAGFQVRAPRVWSFPNHGWAEFIERAPCADFEEVRTFYRRAGMLLCLAYAVRGSDLHQQNLIARGSDPTPVDLETLFVPDIKTFARVNTFVMMKESAGVRRFLGTALQTLLLPAWLPGPDGLTALDISGLGSPAHEQPAGEGKDWSDVNTDAMRFGNRRVGIPQCMNLPAIGDTPVEPADFVPEMTAGFELAYRALMRHREALLAPEGPIEAFRGCAVRMVLRATRTYEDIGTRSLAPRFLRNGIDRSLEFEVMSRSFLAPDAQFDGSRVFLAELEALERLDIPRFDAHPEGDCLGIGGGDSVPEVLRSPALSCVKVGIAGFDEEDLEYQLELIRASFAARDLRPESRGKRLAAMAPGAATLARPLEREELIARARAIADRIARRAVPDGAGARWIGIDYDDRIDRCCLQAVTPSLYAGRAGLALFFAAVYATAGKNPEHRRLALSAAHSVCDDFWGPGLDAHATAVAARVSGIGMAAGVPGIAYALRHCARLLDEPGLLDDALRMGRLVTAELIEEDRRLDVMGGAAGAILGLLSLHEATGDAAFLDPVARAADLLARHQLNGNGDTGGWITVGPAPVTGFSHGAAGIALALARACRATGTPAYRDAAHRAIGYERSVFLMSENNWPRFRGQTDPLMGAWCYGAPGIGLARLGCMAAEIDDDRLPGEIEIAARWLQANEPGVSDHLCCGEFGKLDMLLEAGRRLGRPDWIDAAQRRASAVIDRADADRGGFHSLAGSTETMFTPGFFNGLAGMGYQMLRLADTDGHLPGVLLCD